ncbi:MAG TPA: carboxypeptidase-like regulatory domain-containing protein [Candidatus Angelobacter sp.]|nr:carboxypeptidase-like regulatory domain-containing protein [Candidatus Angelobacter sp.]
MNTRKQYSLATLLGSLVMLLVAIPLMGQAPTGTLRGTVVDPSGARIAGAHVTATDNATATAYSTESGTTGEFLIGNLNAGSYTLTITKAQFKTATYRDVNIIVSETYTLTAKLTLGAATESVEVTAGAEVIETDSPTVGTSITGRSITELPFTSRSALDLATLMPGAATTGRARQTSFDGLPKGSINITYDGINAQDNLLKSNDGFFTITRPSVDAVQEFSISTAANSAQDASQGAVQIKMETQRGGNAFHGGGWWYIRNDWLNSNYYFNNLAGVPRQVQRLNQFGGKLGGPLWKDKVFFFADIDNYTSPQSRSFTRQILTTDAANGLFTYATNGLQVGNGYTTCVASSPRNNGGAACTVNLAAFAAAKLPAPFNTLALDPATAAMIANTQGARTMTGVSSSGIFNPWLDNAVFNQAGNSGPRRFPDVRLDWNVTKNDQISAIYHYSHFSSSPDFLNNANPFLPSGPLSKQLGSQISNRNQWTAAWRRNIGATMSNEVRFGFQTALVAFFPDETASYYPTAATNLGNIPVRPVLNAGLFPGAVAAANFQPFLAYNTQARNTPLGTITDNLSWSKGRHNFSFGGDVTEIRFHQFLNGGRLVQTANIGLVTSDPANGALSSAANFPGITSITALGTTQLTALGQLYAALTGHISSYAGTISVNPANQQYVPQSPNQQAGKQHEFGFFGQDSWRMRPNLTVTYGLRWEYQGAPYDTLNETFSLTNGLAGVWGQSGLNNLFQPGNLAGTPSTFQLNNGKAWYNTDMSDFAPSLGLAWQPDLKIPLLKTLLPGGGRTVFRAGYSISYTREGFNNFLSIATANPGIDGTISAIPVAAPSCATAATSGHYDGGCLTLNQLLGGSLQTLTTNPSSFAATGTVPLVPFTGQTVNAFDPNLRTPRVQSWSAGIQRELGKDTVLEIRYVANHATGLWRQDNLNEVNIFENGFLNEFNHANNNMAICRANSAACLTAQGAAGVLPANQTVNNFANWGLANQVALPILTAAFGPATSSNFRSGTFTGFLNGGTAGAFANTLAFNSGFMCNLAGSNAFPVGTCAPGIVGAFPVNFFVANPWATSGAFRTYNGSQSTYNAAQVEVRRRMAKGLQLSANYSFSKSLTNNFADSSLGFAGFTSLRDQGHDKGISPWDLRHVFKADGIYELPFGPGHRWSTGNGFLNRVIGGWQISSIHRWQSGRVFLLTSGLGGTTNQNDPGVILNGITPSQLQGMLSPRVTPSGTVVYFPSSMVNDNGTLISNTIQACNTPGALCQRLFLTGPSFYRADISLGKKTPITEKVNFEFRVEALNAFNNVNFFFPGDEATSVPTAAVSSTTFGRITNAFRDANTTDDNGGRIIQLVVRINF